MAGKDGDLLDELLLQFFKLCLNAVRLMGRQVIDLQP